MANWFGLWLHTKSKSKAKFSPPETNFYSYLLKKFGSTAELSMNFQIVEAYEKHVSERFKADSNRKDRYTRNAHA